MTAMLITVISISQNCDISASPHIYVQLLPILYAPMGITAKCVRDRTIFILFRRLETQTFQFKEHQVTEQFLISPLFLKPCQRESSGDEMRYMIFCVMNE